MTKSTLYRYKCRCGACDFLCLQEQRATCRHCLASYPRSPGGVIALQKETTEQNEFFDAIYQSGRSHQTPQFSRELTDPYHRMIAEAYLNNCGLALDSPLENRDLLEVACGAGSLSAAMLPHPAVRNCTFHAFDISPHGPEMLARFACTVNSSNLLELSVQDARAMLFDDSTFDVVWGNSVLHHLDDLAGFLTDCKRILKPGGVLTFGEPFAVGYGLGYAVLKIAQVQLGTQYETLDNAYNGIARRIKSRGDEFAALVDKHLFFQPALINLGRQIGFESVNLFSVPSYHYYQNSFIDALLTGMRISDSRLAQAGKELYRTIVDLFDADSLVYSLGAFMQIAMRA